MLKKKGLLAANLKEGKEAGEGYGYLKNVWWWTGMILSAYLLFYPGEYTSGVGTGGRRCDQENLVDMLGTNAELCVKQ